MNFGLILYEVPSPEQTPFYLHSGFDRLYRLSPRLLWPVLRSSGTGNNKKLPVLMQLFVFSENIQNWCIIIDGKRLNLLTVFEWIMNSDLIH